MQQRIIGFDLARGYAIFGMFIVNFNFCFGSFQDSTFLGRSLNLFVGNSTAIFIILAGMGLSFMSNKTVYSLEEKKHLKSIVLKRSWLLLAMGLILFSWWPGDILHFYAAYMHIAAFFLFSNRNIYLIIAAASILIFHVLLQFIPIDTSWNFETFQYADFWTPLGFLRNTIYNGWNSIFPWLAYFMTGMYLGRLNWHSSSVKIRVFITGLIVFCIFEAIRYYTNNYVTDQYLIHYIMSEYFPAYIPFMMITMGFAFMVIAICMFIGEKFSANNLLKALALTGRMTLSFYVLHITIGMILFSKISGKLYTGYLTQQAPSSPAMILGFASLFFMICVVFAILWNKKFKNGPLESLMRWISG